MLVNTALNDLNIISSYIHDKIRFYNMSYDAKCSVARWATTYAVILD